MGPSPAGRGGHIPRKTDAGQHQRPETPGGPLSGGRLRCLGQAARVIRQALRRAAEETAEGRRLSRLRLGGAQLPAGEGLPGDLRLFRPDLLAKTAALAAGSGAFPAEPSCVLPSGLLLPEQQDPRSNAGADRRQFRSKPRYLGASSRCISSGRGTERARSSPVTGCRSRRAKEWRAGRGMRAASSVP